MFLYYIYTVDGLYMVSPVAYQDLIWLPGVGSPYNPKIPSINLVGWLKNSKKINFDLILLIS